MLPSRSARPVKFIVQQPFSKVLAPARFEKKKVVVKFVNGQDGQEDFLNVAGIAVLAVELLYIIQLLALSEHLPSTCRHIKNIFDASPPSLRAQYITRRIVTDPIEWPPNLYSKVYDTASAHTSPQIISTRCAAATNLDKFTELPKHLFRRLNADSDDLLPFLRLIEANPVIPPLNVNAHNGFALTMAHAIAVIVAIRKKDLELVRLLIEPLQYRSKSRGFRKDLPSERPELLKVAIQVDARDIVDYLREKGCVPDLGMIKLLGS
ncbi:hypothetical protein CPB85DRAFT_1562048 [Mucidula mucida]|nr:hypothetical protein CPB85DRAFT_1562048 [Mucidula mucida]